MATGPDERRIGYCDVGGSAIGYQVSGQNGSHLPDVVFLPALASFDGVWNVPSFRTLIDGLGRFARVISHDRRGTGCSDAPANLTWEDWSDDLEAVLDAVGAPRPFLVGFSDGAAQALHFAAQHPARTAGIALWRPHVWGAAHEDAPVRAAIDARYSDLARHWGTPAAAPALLPSFAGRDEAALTQFMRVTATRGSFRAWRRATSLMDLRPLLPLVTAPVLLLRQDDEGVYAAHLDHLEQTLPAVRSQRVGTDLVVEPGGAVPFVEELVTGGRQGSPDRQFAAVLFVDVVDSTRRAVEQGDEQWRRTLDDLDRRIAAATARHDGRVVKQLGDGALCTFTGPARSMRAAAEMVTAATEAGLSVRLGIHAGEVEVRGDDVAGIAVHAAARVAGAASPGEILVSRTVKDLVAGSELRFVSRGRHALKGLDDEWELYAVT